MPRRLGKNPEIYNIPAHLSFVDVLAKGIIDRFGDTPLQLSEVLILLPNRRAVRSLRDAFLRLMDGKPLILPMMQPIGDVDEDELLLGGGTFVEELDLKPAVPTHIRQMILMNVVHSWYKTRDEEEPESAGSAVLAQALGEFLDQVQTEDLDFNDLQTLVPEEYALHWQQTLEFLSILTESWPELLAATGYMDAAARRNKLLGGLRERWLENPPSFPIIAAGSTGSIKATSSLLEVIARLPQGMIVLPGLDIDLDDESWDGIEESHPQAMMKNLLDTVGADRVEVNSWLKSKQESDHVKTRLFREIMRPIHTTDKWRDLDQSAMDGMAGITQIVTSGSREEAGVIALMMREQLETSGKTAALVTPDRMLARQVAGELNRWQIEIDDSAGTPLFNTAPGIFLRLTAEMVSEKLAPVPLMSTLKHPFTSAGQKIGDFRKLSRRFEHECLRGVRPAPGIRGIDALLKHESAADDVLADWWQRLKDIIEPFETLHMLESTNFEEMLRCHIEMAEKLAATDEQDGALKIWKGDAGEEASNLVNDLLEAAPYLRNFKADQYAALLNQFMQNATVRKKYGQHPRLNIWGPLEARLQHADLMILAGLNEGVWPADPAADPWMSRPMRRDFGLPSVEQKIGLSAHDFVQTASAEKVVITRSEKLDGTPMVKSRWLGRLHAIVGDHHHEKESKKWLHWYQHIDSPDEIPTAISPPEPKPPVEARPRKLSVTDIQKWMQDPYSIYAGKILRLKKLDDLDQDPGAIDKGIIIHDILEDFMSRHKDNMPEDAEEILINIGEHYFREAIDKPTVRAFWWPRFKQIAKWFIENEKERRGSSKTLLTETKGEIDFKSTVGMFKLTARADRIDQNGDGGLSIIDYKTGKPPTLRALKAGFAPQLPLEAVIAEQGGFHLLPKSDVTELSYWQLSGGEPAGHIAEFNETKKVDVKAEIKNAYEGLVNLVVTFDKPDIPYLNKPRPEEVGYGEFDHLARTREWGER